MKFKNFFKKKLKDIVPSRYNEQASLDDILNCFRLILGRYPSPEECQGHENYVSQNLKDVVTSYLNSLEFEKRNLFVTPDLKIECIEIDGFKIFVDLDDCAIGKNIATSKIYEPHVTAILASKLKLGMNFLDIGANIGFFSLLAASIVGNTGKVYSIEPNENNCKLLQASKHLNQFSCISILQFAASSEAGLLGLNSSFSNGVTSEVSDEIFRLSSTKTIPALKLDDYSPIREGVDIIKIDIEGAEYKALFGMQALIKKHKPLILSEFSPSSLLQISAIQGIDYLRFIGNLGYYVSVIDPNGTIYDHFSDYEKTLKAFENSNTDHIDLLFSPC